MADPPGAQPPAPLLHPAPLSAPVSGHVSGAIPAQLGSAHRGGDAEGRFQVSRVPAERRSNVPRPQLATFRGDARTGADARAASVPAGPSPHDLRLQAGGWERGSSVG